jgi:hypothetical protein
LRRNALPTVLMLCLAAITTAKALPKQAAPAPGNGPTSANYNPGVSPGIAALQAQEQSAFARGDIATARDLERQVQALLIQEQQAVPQPEPVVAVEPPGSSTNSVPDQLIWSGGISASSADWEMDGTMWAAFGSASDSLTFVFKSTNHGGNWTRVGTGFYWPPLHPVDKIELVVGQDDSGFVYVFENVPANNGDLKVARMNKDGTNLVGWSIRAGADTITDFTACRDFSGSNYWLYAIAYNGLRSGNYPPGYMLRSTDYGVTWAQTDSSANKNRPRMAFGAGSVCYLSAVPAPHTFQGYIQTMVSTSWSSPGTWHLVDYHPDTFRINDACIAPAFTTPPNATSWLGYAHNNNGSSDWDIFSAYATDTLLNWVGPDTVANTSHPEGYVDLKNYTALGNSYVNLSFVDIDLSGPDNAWQGYSSSGDPSTWHAMGDPWINQSTHPGWGFTTFPRLVYSPGGGSGGGLVFVGEGGTNAYFNAGWYGHAAPSAESLYFKAYAGTALMCAAKSANPSPTNRVPMSFRYGQSVPCLDPLGNYVYEVYADTLRRFSTTTGSYTDYPLSHTSGLVCATDGNYIFVPNSESVFKYTVTGGYVNTTTLDITCDAYSFAVANDTVWASPDRYGHVFKGYAASRFNGGSITASQSWDVGPGTNGTGNIAWDGAYYYVIWIGSSPVTFKRFTAARALHDSGQVSIDPRSVMTLTSGVGVAEPAGAGSAVASFAVAPSPLGRGPAFVRYSLPGAAPATIILYDVAGRPVYRQALPATASGAARLDLGELADGVYLVRLAAGAFAATQKLVLQH